MSEVEQGPQGAGVVVTSRPAQVSTSIVGRNGGTITPIRDSARASELARRRWDKVGAAARRGMAKAGQQIPDISTRGSLAVVEYLVEQHTLNAADPSAKGSAASFQKVMDVAYPAPSKAAQVEQGNTVTVTLTDGAMAGLAELLLSRRGDA